MALSQNANAMRVYAGLSDGGRAEILRAAGRARSSDEMSDIVRSLSAE